MTERALVAVPLDGRLPVTDGSLVSASRLAADVLVVDDRPEEEKEARAAAERAGAAYYRSPRPLGPARLMNLVVGHARERGYESVLVCRPGVTVPETVVAALSDVAAGGRFASVAAFAAPPLEQATVDWIAGAVAAVEPVDVSHSGGPCVLFPLAAVREVGLFDPIYRSGTGHLVDWSERARGLGYRCIVAPNVYVSAGEPAGAGNRPDPIVHFRHPTYEDRTPSQPPTVVRDIVTAAARQFGYTLEVGWPTSPSTTDEVRVVIEPDGDLPGVTMSYAGLLATGSLDGAADICASIVQAFGAKPRRIIISERGRVATQLTSAWNGRAASVDEFTYPQRV